MDRWEGPLKEGTLVLNEALRYIEVSEVTVEICSTDRRVHVHERAREALMSEQIRATYETAECVVLHEASSHDQGSDFWGFSRVKYVITACFNASDSTW